MSAKVSNPIEHIGSVVDLMLKPSPFKHTQPIFTYSSLFPLDYKFNKLELQQLWEVLGFLHQVPLVEEFNDFFEKLLVTQYFCENKKEDKNGVIVFYTIPTLLHEIVKHLASYDYRLLDKQTKDNKRKKSESGQNVVDVTNSNRFFEKLLVTKLVRMIIVLNC